MARVSVSGYEWAIVLSILGDRCMVCGSREITQDHVKALSKGGAHHPANLQPLCHQHNTRKGSRTVDYRTPEQREQIAARFPRTEAS